MNCKNLVEMIGFVGRGAQLTRSARNFATIEFKLGLFETNDARPQWFNCIASGKLAESTVAPHAKEGARVAIKGRLQVSRSAPDAGTFILVEDLVVLELAPPDALLLWETAGGKE